MKTTIGALKLALARVMKATDTKNVVAVLDDKGIFSLHGYFGGAHAKAIVKAMESGSIGRFRTNLNGKLIAGILSGLPADTEVRLNKVARGIQFAFGGAKIVLDHTEELQLEAFDADKSKVTEVTVAKASDFSAALRSVMSFASKDDLRFFLRGICIHGSADGQMILAATDGFRVGVRKTQLSMAADLSIILPREFAFGLADILEGDKLVAISVQTTADTVRRMIFATDDFTLNAPLLSAKFPDYAKVIPGADRANFAVEVNAREMASAIERMSLVSTTSVSLGFYPSDEQIIVRSTDEESREAVGVSYIQRADDKMLPMFCPRYLTAALACPGDETVTIMSIPTKTGSGILIENQAKDWKAFVMGVNA